MSGGEKSLVAPRLRLRRLPRPAVPLLHPGRGRGRPRRRQHRPLPAADPPLLRPRPVRHRHPPETHHGRRRRPLRRDHGRRRRDQSRQPQTPPRRVGDDDDDDGEPARRPSPPSPRAAGDGRPGRLGGDPGRLRPPPRRPGREVLRGNWRRDGVPAGRRHRDGTLRGETARRCRERHGDVRLRGDSGPGRRDRSLLVAHRRTSSERSQGPHAICGISLTGA